MPWSRPRRARASSSAHPKTPRTVCGCEITSGLGSLLAGRAMRFGDPQRPMLGGTVLSILLICATPFTGGIFALLFVAQALRGWLQGVVQPIMFSVQAKAVGPHRQGSVVGLRQTMNRLAAIVIPPAMGVIADHCGADQSFVIPGTVLLVLCAPVTLLTRRVARTMRSARAGLERLTPYALGRSLYPTPALPANRESAMIATSGTARRHIPPAMCSAASSTARAIFWRVVRAAGRRRARALPARAVHRLAHDILWCPGGRGVDRRLCAGAVWQGNRRPAGNRQRGVPELARQVFRRRCFGDRLRQRG